MAVRLIQWTTEPETFAVFDTVVDTVTMWDATLGEVRELFLDIERRRAEVACDRFIERGPSMTREEAIETETYVHGRSDHIARADHRMDEL